MSLRKATTRTTGTHWEDAALAHLQHQGMKLVERNFICRVGEIDLILRDRDQLVFAEVRYRGDAKHGDGTLSVGAAKRAKLVRAASAYLQAHAQFSHLACRFDVVGCSGTLTQPEFEWTRAAFDAF
jgi:putative endonuclease